MVPDFCVLWFPISVHSYLPNIVHCYFPITLDKGESSAIAFAIEQKDCLLIIDDYKGRKYAEQLGIKITGTLGVIIDAKLSGHLEFVKPLLERIKMTDFRLTPELERRTLEKSREV